MNMFLFEDILCSVHSSLHTNWSIWHNLVYAEIQEDHDVLYHDEHPEPLQVSEPLPVTQPHVDGHEAAVGDDADDSGELEGEEPSSNISDSSGLGFPVQMNHLVSIKDDLSEVVDQS